MRMIIDTDAGVDDAEAILLALMHPDVQIEAITTVCGNVSLVHVIPNVFTTLDVMKRSIPVYRGASGPLIADWSPEPFHGADGLGNYAARLPFLQCKPLLESEVAALALIRLANAYPGELTLVALAPMTNIALATRLDPSFPGKIKRLVFMGGATSAMGNTVNIAAEWNIFCDPEAAYIVLSSFPQATMISWEATLRHPLLWAQYDALSALTSPAAQFFEATSRLACQTREGMGLLIPDPLAMAVALDPSLVRASQQHYVTVELGGRHTRGQTVIDHERRLGHEPSVEIVTEIDMAGVFGLFERALALE